MALVPRLPTAAAGTPLHVGVVGGLGFDTAGLGRTTLSQWGRPATPVAFPAWGSLVDHAAGTGGGLIDAAVLPAEEAEEPLALPPDLRGVLLLRTARPCRIGVALRHPRSEAALRSLLPNGSAAAVLALPPAMLVGNLMAGMIDAALLLGTDALVPDEAMAGLAAVPLGPEVAATLLPRLTVRLRPGPSDRGGSWA